MNVKAYLPVNLRSIILRAKPSNPSESKILTASVSLRSKYDARTSF